jgi:hypothetical protein
LFGDSNEAVTLFYSTNLVTGYGVQKLRHRHNSQLAAL